jgi:hypothetical protein
MYDRQIYVWRSEALKQYGLGYIIALGLDIEEARNVARFNFVDLIKDKWEFLLPEYNGGESEEYDEKLQQLEQDISTEPEVVDRLYISGSE